MERPKKRTNLQDHGWYGLMKSGIIVVPKGRNFEVYKSKELYQRWEKDVERVEVDRLRMTLTSRVENAVVRSFRLDRYQHT